MEDSLNSIVEERVELMSSSNDKTLELRQAHFIKPSIAIDSIDGTPIASLPRHCLSPLPATFEPKKWHLKVNFVGWRWPQKDWETWVHEMVTLHESTWKKAGIFEAIMSSKYKVERNNDLVFGVAEKWCHETKSFIFPWGEATITLEDMMILGGYSVLGLPVFTPIETKEMKKTLEKLINARREMNKSSSKKASHGLWIKKFKDIGSEIEHEAFLALWLSRFVLPSSPGVVVVDNVFPIAIHLARGTRIALGPAVLANIYRDLSCLKQNIVASTQLGSNCDHEIVALRSPLILVQVWVWERFSDLRPKPKSIEKGEPRLALWHDLKCNVQDVRSVLDSAKERFEWRPYVNGGAKFYSDAAMWVRVDSRLDNELLSFARCVRVSELVGLDCIEQYLPHRVSLQFGFDQDVPGNVPRSNGSPEIAWSRYNKTFGGGKLFIPSRIFEADVTAGYSTWWKRSMLSLQDESKTVFRSSKMIPKSLKPKENDDTCSGFKRVPQTLNRYGRLLKRNEKGGNGSPDQCSPLKRLKLLAQHSNRNKEVRNARFVGRSSSLPREYLRKGSNSPAFGSEVNIESKNGTSSFRYLSKPSKELQPDFEIQKELNNSPFPPGFAPKGNILQDKSCFRDKVIVASSVPPGFTPKSFITEVSATMGRSARNHDSMEKKTGGNHEMSASHPGSVSSDSDEEDKLTIAEMLKSNKFEKTDCRDALEYLSGQCSVAGNEVPRCKLITKLGTEQAASSGAAFDGNGGRPTIQELTSNLEARVSRLERLLAERKAAKEVKSVTKAYVILD